jgi:dethiobiotin synthetase
VKRLYVTGTDTDIGKTRVTTTLARALRAGGEPVTVVKLVQTGLPAGTPGDAHEAGALARCGSLELRRFAKPADPWTAALAASEPPLRAAALAERVALLSGSLVVEGSGGAAVPLNEAESLSDAARLCGLETVLVVGLRLGCINHALLTLEYLASRAMPLLGVVLCERYPLEEPGYAAEVERALAGRARVLGTIAYEPEAALGLERDARLFGEVGSAFPAESKPL